MEKMGCNLLHGLVQVRLGQAVGQPLHGGDDHGVLCLPAPLQAAESSGVGLAGHGVLWLWLWLGELCAVAVDGLETENTTRRVGESINNIYFLTFTW